MSDEQAAPRKRLSAERRREQLADAAVAVIAEAGYSGATADAIAQRAGTSKGLLWHYFSDRDDLLEFTARRTLALLRDRVATDIDLTQAAPEVIPAAVRRAVALRTTHRDELASLREIVVHLRHADGSLRLGLDDFEETYAGQEALFRRGQVEGHFDPHLDPRLMAVVYQGAVDAVLTYLDAHPAVDAERYAEHAAAVLLRGFCGPGASAPVK
ncbi:TetR/AcrR family transcriptional regulator [Spongisporangium articulatum]|uniref:TetR/AcrR family transcriptional regulator n=1 Tax=Spongisporangium articulatum TaxID=3362603 RepID=A0ABW8ATW9_9ACTN